MVIEEVMSMLFLTLFILTVVTICAFAVWPLFDGSPERSRSPHASAAATKPNGPPSAPESLEGVLVVQLMAGEISKSQYLRSIEGLAARDDDRHPLAVPPDTGTADA